jgi:SpoVK/Ycf46/Vps4 family AAA+-type ATPase
VDPKALITSLRRAIAAAPDDLTLRLHLAELLVGAGDTDAAITELGEVLRQDPTSAPARRLMAGALAAAPTGPAPEPAAAGTFDWSAAERQVADVPLPPKVERVAALANDDPTVHEAERPGIRLADVGGMEQVKQRLEIAFLAPMRNPALSRLYGKSLRGGLLLYGPPGCGKTFVARAVAGELGASFLSVGISDVLEMYLGNSERNLHELFQQARRASPCVLFFDEVDALGQRRSRALSGGMRTVVNQLLTELDDVHASNDGVFVLAATNQPWEVDPALRRPGRFDRVVLVLPPDPPARQAILRYHLRDRPVGPLDLAGLVASTDGWSGADLAHLCETAAERALLDSVRSGTARMITMADLAAALAELRPSTGPWFDAARNVAMFANEGGAYDDLIAYLRTRGML